MFKFFKEKLNSIYNNFSEKLFSIFNRSKIDSDLLNDLEKFLISSDIGFQRSKDIIKNLEKNIIDGKIEDMPTLKKSLEVLLINYLEKYKYEPEAKVFLMVGINGSGKTTFCAKMAKKFQLAGKKVLLVAADTFRAAATEQLANWANKFNIDIITGKENQDPASLVFTACDKFKHENYDILIIDTAGRLQTKTNLMKELEKIKKIINNKLIDYKISTLLSVDAMLGQNSFEQAKIFNESTKVDGIVLTKMDGTGKGGIIFSITDELKVPIAYISFGEQVNDMIEFNSQEYIKYLFK